MYVESRVSKKYYYLLFICATTGADGLIARAFSGNPVMTILAASLVGVLSPFCSCGVIPLIDAMLESGVRLAPVMAFCVSSPIMDPEMFILTAAGISLNFAIAKTIAASGMGLMAGFTVLGLQKAGCLYNPLKTKAHCGGAAQASTPMRKKRLLGVSGGNQIGSSVSWDKLSVQAGFSASG